MEGGKFRKARQQVTTVQYLTLFNVIELTYDQGLGIGCKTEGHVNIRFPKLYVLPCSKTLQCPYFKQIFDDKPSVECEVEVTKKQQFFINACHKVCFTCLENQNVQGTTYVKCNECKEGCTFHFSYCTQLMNMYLCTCFRIHSFKDFHDLHNRFESYIQFQNGKNSRKKRKATSFMILQCKFIHAGFAESEVLRLFGIKEKMHVMISFSTIPNQCEKAKDKKRKQVHNDNLPLPFWIDDTYSKVWKNYYFSSLIKTQHEPMLVLDGNTIIQENILEISSITFNMVLMIYHSKLWEDYSYKMVVNEVNHYY